MIKPISDEFHYILKATNTFDFMLLSTWSSGRLLAEKKWIYEIYEREKSISHNSNVLFSLHALLITAIYSGNLPPKAQD